MTEMQKGILEDTVKVDLTLDDLKQKGILETAEDEQYYYIVTDLRSEPDYKPGDFREDCFWMVDKKTGEVRHGLYVTGIINGYCDLPQLKPPFDKLKIG